MNNANFNAFLHKFYRLEDKTGFKPRSLHLSTLVVSLNDDLLTMLFLFVLLSSALVLFRVTAPHYVIMHSNSFSSNKRVDTFRS